MDTFTHAVPFHVYCACWSSTRCVSPVCGATNCHALLCQIATLFSWPAHAPVAPGATMYSWPACGAAGGVAAIESTATPWAMPPTSAVNRESISTLV